MSMNPLPPQAYTKDTLVEAYAWLQSQSESIKEIATTPDILVSLYMKAKMQGMEALERPSIQNFKSELKSLVGIMGEFEIKEHKQVTQVTASKVSLEPVRNTIDVTHSPILTQAGHSQTHLQAPLHPNNMSHSVNNNLNNNYNPGHYNSGIFQTTNYQQTTTSSSTREPNGVDKHIHPERAHFTNATDRHPKDKSHIDDVSFRLDPKSIQMIKDTKEHFNLSTDEEALRMIVAAGFQQLSRMWK